MLSASTMCRWEDLCVEPTVIWMNELSRQRSVLSVWLVEKNYGKKSPAVVHFFS